MNGEKFSSRFTGEGAELTQEGAPLGGTKSEAMQRLQVGLSGIGAMVLVIGLANILGAQADRAEEGAVPDAAPTTEPTEAAPQRDPLADAGIVPDIPAEPAQQPAPSPGPVTSNGAVSDSPNPSPTANGPDQP